MSKQRSRRGRVNSSNTMGNAIDLMLSGHSAVVGRDFILTRRDPYNADIGHLNPEQLRTYDQKFVDSLINLKADNQLALQKNLEGFFHEYWEYRSQLGEFQNTLHKEMFKYDVEASKELGNFDVYLSKVVIRNDAEMNVLFDYIALYRMLNNKRAVTQWCIDRPKLIKKKNKEIATAYENAQFAILRLDKNLEHGAIKTTNIFTNSECILIDRALNRSKKEGCFFICSILDMGNYVMTTGGGIPIDPESSAGKSTLTLMKKYMDKLQKSDCLFSDISECVREIYGFCLRAGALQYMTVG